MVILTATSGDTGKAALDGFADVPGTKIIVFYPQNGVSAMQKLQMVTQQGGNVAVCAIEGNFDDAQNGVKKIFADREMKEYLNAHNMEFSSANSINFGRLVPQIEFISFSRHVCNEVRRLQSDAVVVYVSSDMNAMRPAELKELGYQGLSYQLNVLMNHPEILDDANRLGIVSTLWMVNDRELIDWAARHGVTYVSTDCPDKAKAYLEAVAAYRTAEK